MTNGTSVFAATTNGIYQGEPWRRVSSFVARFVATSMAAGSNTFYAVATGGLWKSTDVGVTWTQVFEGAVTTLAVTNRVLIGTIDQGVLASDDGGQTFTRIDDSTVTQPVQSLAASGGIVYVGAAYQPDVYVAKISPLGDQTVFSAFVGGAAAELSPRIALDGKGNLLIAAQTFSTDFAATFGAVQRTPGGGADVLLARLSPSFDLQSVSYFGGSSSESPGGLAVDAQGFIYLGGTTTSPDLPLAGSPSQRTLAGGSDAFLAVINPGFSSLAYCSYFGTSGDDRGEAIAVTPKGAAYLGGSQGADGFVASFSGLVSFGSIRSIRNAASLVEGPIAPESAVVIEGSGFGSIFGLAVTIGGSTASVLQASDTRIQAAAPADLAPGTSAAVVVSSRNGLFQGSAPVELVAPGLYSANRDGKGVALASLLRIDADGFVTQEPVYTCGVADGSCVSVPIDLGDEGDQLFLILRATGVRRALSVGVRFGNIDADLISANPADSVSGDDLIVVSMPRSLSPGPVTVQVTADGKAANPVMITLN